MSEPLLPGWFSGLPEPHLIGSRCALCGTFYFPRLTSNCRNPECAGTDIENVALSRIGRLWSFTNAAYPPPPPYVASEPYRPFAIVAVELEDERVIVLGPAAEGVGVDTLTIGMKMELVVEAVPDAESLEGRLTWKWKPAAEAAS